MVRSDQNPNETPERTTTNPIIRAYFVEIPTALSANSFEQFIRLRYLKAMEAQARRIEQTVRVTALRRRPMRPDESIDISRSFLLLIASDTGETHLRGTDDLAVENLFGSFNARVTEMGTYAEVTPEPVAES